MRSDQASLDIFLEKERIARVLLRNDQLFWHYHQAWQQSGYAVSPHLPLQGEIPPSNVQRFFRNLFPEGNALDELSTYFQLSKSNTFGLVQALGLDMSGSLIVLPAAHPLPKKGTFRIIPEDELKQRLDTRDDFSLIVWDGKPRLSVAGIQDKINVVLNEKGQIGFGEGSLCSTHILKFEKQKLSHLVLNEYITMQLAKQCGLTVANVQIVHYGNHPTLLIERFDRQLITNFQVKRYHIIDGCQALNLPPEYKYERNFGSGRDVAHIREGASYPKLFDFANQCINPAIAKQKMLDWVLFNILIFNYDAHGKNMSFFVNSKGISLAPFYDLVNIKMYSHFDQEMAMALGDEFDGNTVNAYQLADFADSCHLPRILVANRLKYIITKLKHALNEIKPLTNDENEHHYLNKYQTMVFEQCEHLMSQANEIVPIEL